MLLFWDRKGIIDSRNLASVSYSPREIRRHNLLLYFRSGLLTCSHVVATKVENVFWFRRAIHNKNESLVEWRINHLAIGEVFIAVIKELALLFTACMIGSVTFDKLLEKGARDPDLASDPNIDLIDLVIYARYNLCCAAANADHSHTFSTRSASGSQAAE